MLNVGAAYKINIGGIMSSHIGKSKSTNVGTTYDITAGEEYKLVVGKASITLKADGTIDIQGVNINIMASGDQQTIAKGTITIKGKKILEN